MNIRKTIAALEQMTVERGATPAEAEVAKAKIKILRERLANGQTISKVELDRKIKAAQEEARRKKEAWKADLLKDNKEAAAAAVDWFHKAMEVDKTLDVMENLNSGIQVHYNVHRIFK